MTDKSAQEASSNDNAPSPWGIERFRLQCANNDWLRDIDEEPEFGGPWTDLFFCDFDDVTRQVAKAARLPKSWSGDWMPLAYWLRSYISVDGAILPAIREAAAQPGYTPPMSLEAFDEGVSLYDYGVRRRQSLQQTQAAREWVERCRLDPSLCEPPF
jgi:hypothetical protein